MSDAQVLKAIGHVEAGRLDQAEALCRRVLAKDARSHHAMRVLANVLYLRGRREQALHFVRAAAKAGPGQDAEFLASVGALLRSMGTERETEEVFRRAVAADPRNINALVGWTESLLWSERFHEAADAARGALERHPGILELIHNLAIALEGIGRGEEAVVIATETAHRNPDRDLLLQFAASTRSYVHGLDVQETFQAHRRAGDLLERSWDPMPTVSQRDRSGERLRVAFMSPDLRRHAVCHFVEPIIAGLDRARFHVSCYMLSLAEDDASARLKAKADAWHNVAILQSPALAQKIRDDRIDVLIETSGYTAGHRLAVMALKPAPVQMTYCGYPETTGMTRIDWRIVDSLTDPPGAADEVTTERLLRLDPCFLCYRPPDESPPVSDGPAGRGEPVTFGSFNAHKKTTDFTLRAWAKMLEAVPESRLVIKNISLRAPEVQGDLRGRMKRAGIEPSRVELLPGTATLIEHLTAYGRMDIALDTFPYHGTTTTCEALWMGVPAVSMVGERHVSRVGLSLLTAAGLPGLAARSEQEWIERAVGLARDRAGLIEMRRGMRQRVRASVLCDQPSMAERFGAAIARAVAEREANP